MANKKISELDAITSIDSNDLFVVVDSSEGETNKITKENALSGLQPTISNDNKISSDLVDDEEATNKFVTSSDITNWNSKVSSSDLQTALNTKQDTLTAGTGIDITNNVISSTGGSKIFYFRYGYKNEASEKAVLKDIAEAYDNGEEFAIIVRYGASNGEDSHTAYVTKTSINYVLSFDYYKGGATNKYGVTYREVHNITLYYQVSGDNVSYSQTQDTIQYIKDDVTDSKCPLATGNTTSFTPSGDYNPATKKYVDDSIGGISIPTKTSDLTNDSGFITTESDPVFTASDAYGISSSDISNWNGKQDELVSGTNIKTINNNSLLGSGDITISGGDTTKVFTLSYINLSSQKADLKEIADLYDAGKDFVVIVYYNTVSEGQTIARVTGNSSTRQYNIIGNNLLTYSGNYGFYGGAYKRFMNFNIPFSVSGDTVTIGTKDYNYYQVLRYSDNSSSSLYPLATGNTESYTPTGNYNPATKKYVDDKVSTKQATLVSGTNIKTINGNSILGSGDLVISGGSSDFTEITSSVTTYGSTFTEGESKWYKITTGSLSINLNPSGSKTFSSGSLVLCSKYLTTDGYIAFTIIDDTGIYNYEYLGSSVSSRSKFDDKSPLSQETLGNSIKILDSIPSSTNWAILFEAPITIVTKDITIEYQDTSTSLTETFMFPANTIIVGTLNGLMTRNSSIIIYLSDGEKFQVTNATVASLHIEFLDDIRLTILETNSYMEHKVNDNLPFMSPYKVDKELVACLPLYYQGQTSIDVISLNDILNHYTAPFTNIPRDYNDSQIVDNTVDPNVFADPNYIGITPSNDGITFNNQNSENFFIEINYADVLGNNSVVNTGMMRGDLDINASLTFMASQMTLNFDTTLKSRMFDYIGGGTRETYEGIANHWEVNNYITPSEVYIGPDEMTFDITLSSNYNDGYTLNEYQNNAYLKVLNFGNSLEPGEFERRCYIKIWRVK